MTPAQRQQIISEITSLVGKGRWDQLEDHKLVEALSHARVYAASGGSSARADASTRGVVRMDGATTRDRATGRSRATQDPSRRVVDAQMPSASVQIDPNDLASQNAAETNWAKESGKALVAGARVCDKCDGSGYLDPDDDDDDDDEDDPEDRNDNRSGSTDEAAAAKKFAALNRQYHKRPR